MEKTHCERASGRAGCSSEGVEIARKENGIRRKLKLPPAFSRISTKWLLFDLSLITWKFFDFAPEREYRPFVFRRLNSHESLLFLRTLAAISLSKPR